MMNATKEEIDGEVEKWLLPGSEAEKETLPEPVRDTGTGAAIEAARAEVEAAYIMALRRPRELNLVRCRIIDACARRGFAEAALYRKPVGGSEIRGLSIRAAEEFLRDMGNVRVSIINTYEDAATRRVKISATDLETNAGYSQEITIAKTVERRSKEGREVLNTRTNKAGQIVFVVAATEDEMLTKEAAWVSKIIRNHGLRLVPGDILEAAESQIAKTLANGQVNLKEANRILDAFFTLGIEPKAIEAYLGCSIKAVTDADIQRLREVYTGITEGQARWADYVKAKAEGQTIGQGPGGGTEKPPETPQSPANQPPEPGEAPKKGRKRGRKTAKGQTKGQQGQDTPKPPEAPQNANLPVAPEAPPKKAGATNLFD